MRQLCCFIHFAAAPPLTPPDLDARFIRRRFITRHLPSAHCCGRAARVARTRALSSAPIAGRRDRAPRGLIGTQVQLQRRRDHHFDPSRCRTGVVFSCNAVIVTLHALVWRPATGELWLGVSDLLEGHVAAATDGARRHPWLEELLDD